MIVACLISKLVEFDQFKIGVVQFFPKAKQFNSVFAA